MSIFTSAVEKPITTLMVFLAIIVLGVFSYTQLPVDQYPKMDPPYITVMATYPGANASDIEENVTKPLEDQLNSVDDLKELTSTSSENISVVALEFEWGKNLDNASNDVRDAVDKALDKLPDDIDRPTIMRMSTSMMPILVYAVTANESFSGLNKIIDDKVVMRLNRVNGVAQVGIAGIPERVVYVNLDPVRMDALGMTLEQVSNAIAAENRDVSSGNLKMGLVDYTARIEGEFEKSSDIDDIVLRASDGSTIRLGDIAEVRDTLQDITLEQKINQGTGAIVYVTKQSDANAVKVAELCKIELEKALADMPTDIKFQTIVDNSEFIVNSINNLTDSLMYALISVVIVVFGFLGRWRATMIIALTIPISLIVAFIYLFVSDGSINMISLMSLSIAIGMVVDDAIVVLENITKHIERGSRPREAAKYGTNEVWTSVIVTTLVTVAVFFPLTLIPGIMGIFFKPLGWIVCVCVCTSTLTAISLTPMLSSQLLRLRDKKADEETKRSHRFNFYVFVSMQLDKLDAFYERIIRWVLCHKTFTILGMSALFISSMFLLRFINTDFFPQNDQGNMSVYVKMQPTQRAEETGRIAARIDSTFRADIPELTLSSFSYGSEETASFTSMMSTTGSNVANMRIRVTDMDERDRSIFEIADQVRDILKSFPDVLAYTVTMGNSSTTSNTVDMEIMGHDFTATANLAKVLADKARMIPGAEDINISRDDDKPEIRVRLDREKLARHGLTTTQVGTAIRYRIYGNRQTKFKEDGEEYDIIVRLDEEARTSITGFENIQITDGFGQRIRLKEIGTIFESYSPPSIERKSKQRMLSVSITPAAGVSMGEIALAAQKIIDETEIPDALSVYIGGSYEDQQESTSALGLLLVMALILVYIVMAAEFESFKMPFIIMLAIPFAFTGVFLALLLTGTTLSVVALLGAIMLVGIVTKNGIVLIDYINLMRERGVRLYEAIALSCRSRLRPVLMTSLTTIFGMVPMALSFGEGAETWRPMGIAVIGGMVFSTIVTMLIVPAVYAAWDKSGSRNKKKAINSQYTFMSDFDAERDLPKKNN